MDARIPELGQIGLGPGRAGREKENPPKEQRFQVTLEGGHPATVGLWW